jgi:Protein of unknown function (DUF1566)
MSVIMAKNDLNLASSVFLLLLLLLEVPALAGNNSDAAFSTWPDTGQTKCYKAIGEISCPPPGQPFHGQDAQYPGPVRSYTKLDTQGNVLPDSATSFIMVRDNVTGLIWEVKDSMNGASDYSNPHDADNTYTWCDNNSETNGGNEGTCIENNTQDFIERLNSSNFGGYGDWRMPTIKEIITLGDRDRISPAIDPIFASTTKTGYYHTSTTPKYDGYDVSIYSWRIHFWWSHSYAGLKSYAHFVRAVRGGYHSLEDSFIDNGDGTITDTSTCLQWQKATMDINGDGTPDTLLWQEALALGEGLILAGYDDWRLPNINELHSLVDYSRGNPAIDPTFATTTMPSRYWSSTTFVDNNGQAAWEVNFSGNIDGSVGTSKSFYNGMYARAVRGAQCEVLGMLGDIDLSGDVTLTDTILTLQIVAGQHTSGAVALAADVNTDEKIGMAEAIYTLQKVAGLR